LNRAGEQLASLAGEVRTKFDGVVTEVNDITASIVELNRSIVALEADGHSANALRDQRDVKLDRLAELTGAEVIERDSGSVGVLVNGLMLVDGVDRREIAATIIDGNLEVTRADLPTRPLQVGGELGGIRTASSGDIPRMRAELDSLARGIVESVNAIHRTGVTWSGTPPVATNAGDFFASDPLVAAELDPLRTARGIRLDSAVAANASAIAASPATATGPGDSSLALQLSQLRDRPVPFTDSTGATIATESAGDFFRRIATDTAFLARSVGDRAEVDAALTTQADTRRQEVSGVSVDEELVRLIKFQQAYAAAARMIQTVDQMSQTLLDIRR
jgi:flagellar hook-associated protein 1 FlgK